MTWVGFAPPATRYPLSSLPSACFQSGCRPSRDGERRQAGKEGCPALHSNDFLRVTAWAVAPLSPVGVAQIPQQISDTCVLFSLLPKSAATENQNKRERQGGRGTIIIGNKRQTHDTSRCICWSSPKGACASGRGIWLLICTAFCLRFHGLWRLSALWFMLYLCLRFSPQLTRWLGVLFNWKPNCWHSKWERWGKGREGRQRQAHLQFVLGNRYKVWFP